jgi:hypothetical protein
MTIEQRIVVLDDFRAPPDYLTGDRPWFTLQPSI